MASPGLRAGCPSSSLLRRLDSRDSRGFGRACFLISLLEVFLKVLVESLRHKFGVATLQPVVLHLLVKELFAFFGISGHLAALDCAFLSVSLLALAEASEPLATFRVLVAIGVGLVLLLLFPELGHTDVLLSYLALLRTSISLLAASFVIVTLLNCSISLFLEPSSGPNYSRLC